MCVRARGEVAAGGRAGGRGREMGRKEREHREWCLANGVPLPGDEGRGGKRKAAAEPAAAEPAAAGAAEPAVAAAAEPVAKKVKKAKKEKKEKERRDKKKEKNQGADQQQQQPVDPIEEERRAELGEAARAAGEAARAAREAAESAQVAAKCAAVAAYIHDWDARGSGSGWKFNKNLQGFLLKHWREADIIEEAIFDKALAYLKPLKGGARDALIAKAKEVNGDGNEADRAQRLLQALGVASE